LDDTIFTLGTVYEELVELKLLDRLEASLNTRILPPQLQHAQNAVVSRQEALVVKRSAADAELGNGEVEKKSKKKMKKHSIDDGEDRVFKSEPQEEGMSVELGLDPALATTLGSDATNKCIGDHDEQRSGGTRKKNNHVRKIHRNGRKSQQESKTIKI
jgi:hypothetical protein